MMSLDVRLALRRIRNQPGFAASVVLSLGLAIGASAVAFSILDAVRFRALPLRDGDRLVVLSEVQVEDGRPISAAGCQPACSVPYVTYSRVLAGRELRSVSTIAAYASGGKALRVGDATQTVFGTVASASLFDMVGARPLVGRLFKADDNQLGAPPVALLGYGLWATQFGQNASVVGQVVQLSDTRYTVVGIMPKGFDFEFGSQFWLPEKPALDPSTRPSITSVVVMARLAPTASLDRLRGELAAIDMTAVPRARGNTRRFALTAEPLRARYVAATQGRDVLFFVIVCSVLIIACANVTNLMLARALGDRRAFSIRTALGADAAHLVRLLLVEHGILVFAGAGLGLLLAWLSLPLIESIDVLNSPRLSAMSYRIDLRAVGVVMAVAAFIAIAISIVPALLAGKGDVSLILRELTGGSSEGRRGGRTQRAFVIAQVGCAVALAAGGGLAVKRVLHLSSMSLGFDAAHVVQVTPSLPHDWRVREKYLPLAEHILEDLRAVPGVVSASTRAFIPLDIDSTAIASGSSGPLPRELMPGSIVAVEPDYFQTLQVRLLRGRTFSRADRERGAQVAIVNEWAAARWWVGTDALGQTLRINAPDGSTTVLSVVGVVADNKAGQPNVLAAGDAPLLYRPYQQTSSPSASFFVRTRDNPAAIVRDVQRRVAALVPNRPLSLQVMADAVGQQLDGLSSAAAQLVGIAAVGLFLAFTGVHGLVAYSVNRRTRELGIRRAMGATAGGVLTLVVSDALRLATVGVIIGLLAVSMILPSLQPTLDDFSGAGAVYAVTAMLALIAAILSAWLPARRASRVSPQEALRG